VPSPGADLGIRWDTSLHEPAHVPIVRVTGTVPSKEDRT
jgi:hypothetical protein